MFVPLLLASFFPNPCAPWVYCEPSVLVLMPSRSPTPLGWPTLVHLSFHRFANVHWVDRLTSKLDRSRWNRYLSPQNPQSLFSPPPKQKASPNSRSPCFRYCRHIRNGCTSYITSTRLQNSNNIAFFAPSRLTFYVVGVLFFRALFPRLRELRWRAVLSKRTVCVCVCLCACVKWCTSCTCTLGLQIEDWSSRFTRAFVRSMSSTIKIEIGRYRRTC